MEYYVHLSDETIKALKEKDGSDSGGGAGGDSDFSIAEVTFTKVLPTADLPVGIGVLNDELVYFEGVTVDEDQYTYVLYKGSQIVMGIDDAEITVSGNANIVSQNETEPGRWSYEIEITGNCTINLYGYTDL